MSMSNAKTWTQSPLATDLYQLTMAQGYYFEGRKDHATFEMFFRRPPFGSGYTIFAGLAPLLDALENLKFSESDLDYLKSLGIFRDEFLAFLKDFKFTGSVMAPPEGTIVFPEEPLVRIDAPLLEAQIVETLLLNMINYQTLIATKAARVKNAARGSIIMEFGMRRAQGPGASLDGARAAFVGGADATSNVLAGKLFNIPVMGTMAHSWIMSFPTELEAFRTYASYFPATSVFLIDTYDTLGSGIENAIIVAKELKAKGYNAGVRLDSGDLEYLSKEVRKRLDAEGLTEVKIAASNDLNEEIIEQLLYDNAPIDTWGVGTKLITGAPDPSLTGVYKLCALETEEDGLKPVMKIANNREKTTLPSRKQVYRFYTKEGMMRADLICEEDDVPVVGKDYHFYHPKYSSVSFMLRKNEYSKIEPLLKPVMKDGRILEGLERDLKKIQAYAHEQKALLDNSYKRLINPHVYKVSIAERLNTLKDKLIAERCN